MVQPSTDRLSKQLPLKEIVQVGDTSFPIFDPLYVKEGTYFSPANIQRAAMLVAGTRSPEQLKEASKIFRIVIKHETQRVVNSQLARIQQRSR